MVSFRLSIRSSPQDEASFAKVSDFPGPRLTRLMLRSIVRDNSASIFPAENPA
jgi:hypothetical protein